MKWIMQTMNNSSFASTKNWKRNTNLRIYGNCVSCFFLICWLYVTWTYKCRMWHTSLISPFFLSFFICKVFTAYNYFVLSQTEKKASPAGGQGFVLWLWVEYVSLMSKNKVACWQKELFHKWKTCRLIKQTKKQKKEENCCKKKNKQKTFLFSVPC